MEYGWEPYLSERDKKHGELWGKKELTGFGNKPALLLIDFYYSVLGLERLELFESMKIWPSSMGLEGWEAVDRSAELLAVARQAGIPVIHVKALHSAIGPWSRSRRNAPKLPQEMIERGREIVDEVKPIAGEAVIEKTAPSAFQGTPLRFHLQNLGIDTLIVCGESTSGCVRATVVDGATGRFRMGVVKECVFDRTQASHYMNLYDMHQKYADVIPLDAAKTYLTGMAKPLLKVG